jgi:hypothetical protein
METNNQIHSFIRLVMNENLAQAQNIIREALNEKLSNALDEKFESYAPAIFEEQDKLDSPLGPQDGDINNNDILDSDKKKDPSGFYLKNRRDAIGDAINEEEGEEEYDDLEEEEEEEEEEETTQSAPPVQNSMPQSMPQSGASSAAGSDGY